MFNFLLRFIAYIQRQYFYFTNKIRLKIHNIHFDKTIKINGKIYIRNNGNITIGKNVYINSSIESNMLGGSTFSSLVCRKNSILEIGNNVGISNSSITAHHFIKIGDNVMLGNGCKIFDTNFHPLTAEGRFENDDTLVVRDKIIIDKNVFLGTGVVVLKGVTIGENSIVSAHSVVAKSIPSNEIWAGNPARKIKDVIGK